MQKTVLKYSQYFDIFWLAITSLSKPMAHSQTEASQQELARSYSVSVRSD